jgi:hypothetical protein
MASPFEFKALVRNIVICPRPGAWWLHSLLPAGGKALLLELEALGLEPSEGDPLDPPAKEWPPKGTPVEAVVKGQDYWLFLTCEIEEGDSIALSFAPLEESLLAPVWPFGKGCQPRKAALRGHGSRVGLIAKNALGRLSPGSPVPACPERPKPKPRKKPSSP